MDALARLAQSLPEDMDAALITGGTNRRYYTGFASSAGSLLVTRRRRCLIVDSRYHEAALKAVKDCEIRLQDKLYPQLTELLEEEGARSLGLESDALTLRELLRCRETFSHLKLLEDNRLGDLMAEQRQIKSPEEIACIRAAQEMADAAFGYILRYIRPGRSEREIALELEFHTRALGSEKAAFPVIAVSGENTALPHGVPGDRQVRSGDFILMDFGCTVGGYRSDMTRTVAIGHVTEEMRRVYETVLRAQKTAMAGIRPGVACNAVDNIARALIYAGEGGAYKGCFGHGLGHGVGLDIHESPSFSSSCEVTLQPGMVLSVEPGIYLPGKFGVRIEDIVEITGDGCRSLTAAPKELVEL